MYVITLSLHEAILKYPTHDQELYASVHVVKKWKHYLLEKDIVVHVDHQPLQYLLSQKKLLQARHYE